MNAYEARSLAIQNFDKERYVSLLKEIFEAASQGEFELSKSGKLNGSTKLRLEQLGYEIRSNDDVMAYAFVISLKNAETPF